MHCQGAGKFLHVADSQSLNKVWTKTKEGKGGISMRDDFNWPHKANNNKKRKEKVAQITDKDHKQGPPGVHVGDRLHMCPGGHTAHKLPTSMCSNPVQSLVCHPYTPYQCVGQFWVFYGIFGFFKWGGSDTPKRPLLVGCCVGIHLL